MAGTASKRIRLGKREIGKDCPPYVIAEACINHEGEIALARRMVHIAHAMGADAIKFQMHVLDDEMLRETPQSANFEESLYDALDRTNLSLDEHRELKILCETLGIDYLCTPFSAASADLVETLDPIGFKVGSGELTNLPLQRHIAAKGRPMIVSTGMSTIEEIGETVDALKATGVDFILTHCVSIYPCPPSAVNLGNIPRYRERFGVPVGLSDHTSSIYTAIGAIALGACVIEKHLTLDRLAPGPDHKSSIEPYELGELVKGCRAVFEARGAERRIFREEEQIVAWARESVVSLKPIAKGTRITADMVSVKRPSPGPGAIPAKHLDEIVGRTAAADIAHDRQVLWTELA
jgi:sialic acid synthase SpsE